jgi:hypothetical protein
MNGRHLWRGYRRYERWERVYRGLPDVLDPAFGFGSYYKDVPWQNAKHLRLIARLDDHELWELRGHRRRPVYLRFWRQAETWVLFSQDPRTL